MAKKSRTTRKPQVKRTRELEDEILTRVASGRSLLDACKGKGMPDEATVRGWAVREPNGFGRQFVIARMIQAHGWWDEIRSEIDRDPVMVEETVTSKDGSVTDRSRIDGADVNLRRLRVDTLKWGLSKMLPKLYGDKLTLAGDPHAPVTGLSDQQIMERIMALLAKAKAAQMREHRLGLSNGSQN